ARADERSTKVLHVPGTHVRPDRRADLSGVGLYTRGRAGAGNLCGGGRRAARHHLDDLVVRLLRRTPVTKWIVFIAVMAGLIAVDLTGRHILSTALGFAYVGGYWAYRWASAGSTTRRTD